MEHRVRSRSAGKSLSIEAPLATERSGTSWAVGRNTSLDINSAQISQLKSLTGIGEFYAKKIVAGRPYRHREELLTKEILPEYVYGRIMDRLVASQT
jgi:DNA uptake protein ComE-like DNA-binding protein